MKVAKLVLATLTVLGLAAATTHAQVMQLGRVPMEARATQKTGGGLLGKIRLTSGCTTCAPSAGRAGEILGGGCCDEPSCGVSGLGYSGGFGLCGGGDCGACGVGGYFGRNLHRVNPCACGGSLLGDLTRGAISLVDRTVGCVVSGVFGGLRTVTCHASGSFAALECAARASCRGCGGGGCNMCCDTPIYEETMQPTPADPANAGDPFVDDPPAPQARRPHYSSVRRATFTKPQAKAGSGVVRKLSTATSSLKSRYHVPQNRGITLRR